MNVLCVTSGGSCSRKINNKHSRKNVIYAANRLQQFNGKQTIDNIRIFYGKSAPIRGTQCRRTQNNWFDFVRPSFSIESVSVLRVFYVFQVMFLFIRPTKNNNQLSASAQHGIKLE